MATVLITGGNGLIGRHLSRELLQRGYEVRILTRTKGKESVIPCYLWDWEKGEIEIESIQTADYIIHLSGANIGEKKWTSKRKQLIIDSRVKSAELIFEAIKSNKNMLKAFISASAIGYYGTSSEDVVFTETDASGNDFLGTTCSKWERAADRFKELGIRTVKLRAGVVLSKKGGVLARMAAPVRMGITSALGTGKQFFPWIHIKDLCEIYIKAIEDSQMVGAYNAVSPDHKTNDEFTGILSQTLKKRSRFPNVPSLLISLIFGEMAVTVLKGNRVSADKILASGFNFQFPDLNKALNDIFS